MYTATESVSPSPRGEGRGEGERSFHLTSSTLDLPSILHPLSSILNPKAPPHHQFQPLPILIRARDPFLQQIEVWRKPLPQFLPRSAEGRTILVGNQIIDCQILASGLEPPQCG